MYAYKNLTRTDVFIDFAFGTDLSDENTTYQDPPVDVKNL